MAASNTNPLTKDHLKLLKQLDKLSKPAMEAILKVLQDDSVDAKLKADVALRLLETQSDLIDKQTKATLGQMTLQIKADYNQQMLLKMSGPKLVQEEDDGAPQVAFIPNVIQRLDGDEPADGEGVLDLGTIKNI